MPFESGFDNRFHHRRVIQLLCVVNLMTARNTASVVVGNILMAVADGANDVAFHDLHVVDVVKQFEVFGADAFDQLDSPFGVVSHVILVVHLAVEQLHADDDFVLFGHWHQAFQTDGTVFQTLLVRHAAAVSRKADIILQSRIDCLG
jgi:hypothetical protein